MEAARAEREAKARKESNRRYNAKRDPKEGAFYRGKAWRRLSAARIQADGYKCVQCGKFATEVDHIVPIQTPAGWDRRYDWSNLQSLCKTCHNKKHHRFYKGREGGRPRTVSVLKISTYIYPYPVFWALVEYLSIQK